MELIPVKIEDEIRTGMDLAPLIAGNCQLANRDVVVITQKVISKAEGRIRNLADQPFEQLVKQESVRVLRVRGKLAITETRHGFICANAGIDRSNNRPDEVTLLPKNPDYSAKRISERILELTGLDVAVIITDTFGRTWRRGVTDVAIGSFGLLPVIDLRGSTDAFGNTLEATEVCIVDEIAAAAELLKPKNEKVPFVIVRGLPNHFFGPGNVKESVVRHYSMDLFR
jgi:coenzyme F420-0:L-glutamate ligase/coenzyme F420-1:gamma-L-glutamate ligase